MASDDRETPPRGPTDISRRDLIKLGAAATLTASLGVGESLAQSSAPQSAAPVFFTPEEFVLVDELSEMMIPADEHSPGARAAKVASYIDRRLAEAWEEKDKATWHEGLQRIEELSRETNGKPFLQSSPDERVAILTRISRNERNPETREELFFVELKARVVHAYYTSELGIKQEMEYKGNTYLNQFVGFDVS
jgi:hypothetical protein